MSLKLRISVVPSSRHSSEQSSIAPTIEDAGIKEEQGEDDEQTEEEAEDGEDSKGREEGGKQVSGFRRQYRVGVRRAHIVRSVEVDG